MCGVDETNMATGAYIATGNNVRLKGNSWHDNPGQAPQVSGIGVLIAYVGAGAFKSVNSPPSNISVEDRIFNNGVSRAGFGIFIASDSIGNGDVLKEFHFGGSITNNRSTGIETNVTSPGKLTSVTVSATLSGPNQRTPIGPNLSNQFQRCISEGHNSCLETKAPSIDDPICGSAEKQ